MNVESKGIEKFIWIDTDYVVGDTLTVKCNLCPFTAYRDRDVDMPGSGWLARLIAHVVETHDKELARES